MMSHHLRKQLQRSSRRAYPAIVERRLSSSLVCASSTLTAAAPPSQVMSNCKLQYMYTTMSKSSFQQNTHSLQNELQNDLDNLKHQLLLPINDQRRESASMASLEEDSDGDDAYERAEQDASNRTAASSRIGNFKTSGNGVDDQRRTELRASINEARRTTLQMNSAAPAFDAWGARSDQVHDNLINPIDDDNLSPQAVQIPIDDAYLRADGSARSAPRIGHSASSNAITPRGPQDERTHESHDHQELSMAPDETAILQSYDKLLQSNSSLHFGYPYNLSYDHSELYEFMKYSINNLGDPYIASNYAVHSRQFECAVIDFFAKLWDFREPDDYWGYVTSSGTEGNLHGILLARERFPEGILYTSEESHYSLFKAATYYRMECNKVPTLPNGEIDYEILEQQILANPDKEVIINANIGTTVKGAVDNLDRIVGIMERNQIPRERYHIHCDGALYGLFAPFLSDDVTPDLSFHSQPIDSIAVSGHKMLGCPMPCGIAICRKEHVIEHHIDYLNSVDSTILGSRNGQAALYLWYSLRKKGMSGIADDVHHCMSTAQYLYEQLQRVGVPCRYNTYGNTVILQRPSSQEFIRRWQLACEKDMAHVVVMPNITKSKIDIFVQELQSCPPPTQKSTFATFEQQW